MCGHLQLNTDTHPEITKTADSAESVQHFKELAETIQASAELKPGDLIIDVGSNDGTLLKFLNHDGLTVLGIEQDVKIAEEATASGIFTIPKHFDIELADNTSHVFGRATVVTCNNVLADIDYLSTFIDGIKLILKDNGLFIFETPYGFDVIERLSEGIFDCCEHLSYFFVKPLAKFLCDHDIKLEKIQWFPREGGSIRCFARKEKCSYPFSDIVNKFINRELACPWPEMEIVKND